MAKGYYHRSFVILQPWDSKFNIKAEKSPAGYCKIEVRNDKCRMYFHVQDLKPRASQQESYDVFLVSAQEGIAPQRIASIYVDSRGRGECAVEINVNDVGGSGYSLDQFHGLAVVCYDGDGIAYPLVGYANKRVELDWAGRIRRDIGRFYSKQGKAMADRREKDSQMRSVEEKKVDEAEQSPLFIPDDKRQKSIQDIITALQPLLQNKVQESRVEVDKLLDERLHEGIDLDDEKEWAGQQEKPEDSAAIKEQKANEKAEDKHDGESHGISEAPPDVPETKKGRTAPVDAVLNVSRTGEMDGEPKARESGGQEMFPKQDDAVEGKPDEVKGEIQGYTPDLSEKQSYWDKTKEYYSNLFETHRRVYPFIAEKGEVQWVEVPYVGNHYRHAYIAWRHFDSSHFDHYIVGLIKEKGEVRYVAYGVLGPYGTIPPSFMQGFSRWVPSRYGYGTGYWLVYVDAYTGEIAYPY